jgi:hypothetical protein
MRHRTTSRDTSPHRDESQSMDKQILQMTGDEFIKFISSSDEFVRIVANHLKKLLHNYDENYGYGLKGIVETFRINYKEARELKDSGIIDDAIIVTKDSFIVDRDKALKLTRISNGQRKRNKIGL